MQTKILNTVIENPFVVVIDTREQAPFSFTGLSTKFRNQSADLVVPTKPGTLESGDYSIVGFESAVAIERKSKEDLYSTLTHGRARFERELERLNAMEFSAVVVEADFGEGGILEAPLFSSALPKSIYRSIIAFIARYKIHWILCPDRRFAEITTFRLLERFWLDRQKELKCRTAGRSETPHKVDGSTF